MAQAIDSTAASTGNLGLQDFGIRDPNILYYNDTYYMTGTTAGDGFLGYSSPDLVHWTAEGYIYHRNASSTWALQDFWAAEQKFKDGKFYLFFSGKTDTAKRATGVAVATSPEGPYVDLMPIPLTPPDWNCLDGHLFIDDDGHDYFIFSHEWVDFLSGAGDIWIQPIASHLTVLIGNKTRLFGGRDASWSGGVTDGPCMLKYKGAYYLFWSSSHGGYKCGYASSTSILGPYVQSLNPTISGDGGHCTIFRRGGDGELLITYHQPNSGGRERAKIDQLCFDAGAWYLCKDLGYPGSSLMTIYSLLGMPVYVMAFLILHQRKMRNRS